MPQTFPLETDQAGARVLSGIIADAVRDDLGNVQTGVNIGGTPVVCGGPKDLPCKDQNRPQLRRLKKFNGAAFSDSESTRLIRRITNGNIIAFPAGILGMCVRDDAFWAINIGSLVAPTLTVTSSGSGDATVKTISRGSSTIGKAAVIEVQNDGTIKSTRERLEFVRWDDGGTIADGTLIQLAYVSGSLTLVYANCSATSGLTGLVASPTVITAPEESP